MSYAVLKSWEEMTRRLLRECRQPIPFYFDPLDAQQLVVEPTSDLQRRVVAMGLMDPYAENADGTLAHPELL